MWRSCYGRDIGWRSQHQRNTSWDLKLACFGAKGCNAERGVHAVSVVVDRACSVVRGAMELRVLKRHECRAPWRGGGGWRRGFPERGGISALRLGGSYSR